MRVAGARCISKTCRCILSILFGRCFGLQWRVRCKRSLRQTFEGMRCKSACLWCCSLHSFALESVLFQIIITHWSEHAAAWCWHAPPDQTIAQAEMLLAIAEFRQQWNFEITVCHVVSVMRLICLIWSQLKLWNMHRMSKKICSFASKAVGNFVSSDTNENARLHTDIYFYFMHCLNNCTTILFGWVFGLARHQPLNILCTYLFDVECWMLNAVHVCVHLTRSDGKCENDFIINIHNRTT